GSGRARPQVSLLAGLRPLTARAARALPYGTPASTSARAAAVPDGLRAPRTLRESAASVVEPAPTLTRNPRRKIVDRTDQRRDELAPEFGAQCVVLVVPE